MFLYHSDPVLWFIYSWKQRYFQSAKYILDIKFLFNFQIQVSILVRKKILKKSFKKRSDERVHSFHERAMKECHSLFSKGAMWECHSFFWQGAGAERHSKKMGALNTLDFILIQIFWKPSLSKFYPDFILIFENIWIKSG